MAWIESHQSLKDHPKTRKLARLLGISTPTAIGHLHCLWWWSLDYAPEGDMHRYDTLDIAIGGEWDGDPDQFVHAMVRAGFIDRDDDNGYLVHDWQDYAGKLIERKRANAQRMKEARAQHVQDTNDAHTGHVQGTEHTRVELPNQPTIPTKPNQPTIPTDARFDLFWSAYPSNKNKQAAAKAFGKVNWKAVDFDSVMASLEAQKQSAQWCKDGGQFIPHASTWLNNARWQDELPAIKTASSIAEPNGYSRDPDEAQRQLKRDLEEAQRNATSGGNFTVLRGRAV